MLKLMNSIARFLRMTTPYLYCYVLDVEGVTTEGWVRTSRSFRKREKIYCAEYSVHPFFRKQLSSVLQLLNKTKQHPKNKAKQNKNDIFLSNYTVRFLSFII